MKIEWPDAASLSACPVCDAPGPHPVLLRTQMTSGHGGISGRYERWKEVAFQYAWLLAAAQGDQ